MSSNLAALLAGGIFGFGLAVSQMIDPDKVLAFLDVAGRWDPSLLLVMVAALGVMFAAYRLAARRSQPLFAPAFVIPRKSRIDRRLIVGAGVFGVGWGLSGYCPGPGIAALALGTWEAPVFVVALAAGAWTCGRFFPATTPATADPPRET